MKSSGFVGSPSIPTSELTGLWADWGPLLSQAPDFPTTQGFAVGLGNPFPGTSGVLFSPTGPAYLFFDNCFSFGACQPQYAGNGGGGDFILANYTTDTAVEVPAGDTEWELLLASMFICTAGLWVKRRSAEFYGNCAGTQRLR